jgi:ribosomal protein S18 acetylase RimI-like enzyme
MELEIPKTPCRSCPYRCDTPSGVWSPEEYAKLPGFDDNTAFGVFLCHHSRLGESERVCRGWLSVHAESVAVRIAVARGEIPPDAPYEPVTVELHTDGAAAAAAGMAEVAAPSPEAAAMIEGLMAKRRRAARRRLAPKVEVTYVCERSWHTITAHVDGVKVGSLELDFTDDGEWQVVDVVVGERFRRRGIASAMYRFATDHVTAGAPIAHRGDSMSPDAKGLFAALAAADPSAHRYASAA